MNKKEVKRIALENGFKLKQQDDGTNDLNTYVYEFADALVKDQHQKLEAEFNTNLSKVEQGIDEMAQGFLVEIESLKAQLADVKSTNHSLEEINADLSESLKLLKDKYQSDNYVLVNKQMISQLVNELDHRFSKDELLGLTDLIALRDGFSLLLDQKTIPKQNDDYVLVPKDQIEVFWQDDDEPENFCSLESDFNCLGDCLDLNDIMTINKHHQAYIKTEKMYGTWFAEFGHPKEKANFHVGTHQECLDIVAKNKAIIEAQEQHNG